MRPRGISQIVRVGLLSTAMLAAVSGLHFESGVKAQHQPGQGRQPPVQAPIAPGSLPPPLTQPTIIADPVHARMDQERLKAMNDDRHKKLSADVDRLLALSNELKSSVDKTNKDELSVEVIRKAAEIEKLAHDVQSRMKN